jgi:hypothetical protein
MTINDDDGQVQGGDDHEEDQSKWHVKSKGWGAAWKRKFGKEVGVWLREDVSKSITDRSSSPFLL